MKIISILTKNFSQDNYSDGYELRLDYIKNFESFQSIINQIKDINKIIIITLRDKNQGGEYTGILDKKLEIYNKIAKENKDYNNLYFDFEYYINHSILENFLNTNPNSKLIYSYHNFVSTPKASELEKILKEITCKNITKDKIIYKIVTKARTSLDCFELIEFLKKVKVNITAHCMGEYGEFSRIINGIYGSEFTYSFPNQNLGCIPTEELYKIYRINKINKDTKIYALIGNPVSHSIGHKFHNEYFSNLNQNCVYIKIYLLENELDIFFEKIKKLNIYGLSITMPLKEAVFKYISNKDDFKFINAVNTINAKSLLGKNTDGFGAYLALNKLGNIINYDFLFIGAGGAVEGIINEIILKFNNPNIFILNRTLRKAEKIKDKFKKSFINILNFNDFIDNSNLINKKLCVINAVSNTNIRENIKIKSALMKIFDSMNQDSIVMDINYHNDILDLVPKNIKAINGMKMFEEQAKLQQQFWQN